LICYLLTRRENEEQILTIYGLVTKQPFHTIPVSDWSPELLSATGLAVIQSTGGVGEDVFERSKDGGENAEAEGSYRTN
jgi:hypothetical protein